MIFIFLLIKIAFFVKSQPSNPVDPTNAIKFLTYKDYYPSFRKTDYYIGQTLEKIDCPLNCSVCVVEQNNVNCIMCEYGFSILHNKCIKCPDNCQECNLATNLNFTWSLYCSETSKYYYFSTDSFQECSSNCKECQSKYKCRTCNSGYYLNYNGLNDYSCFPCSSYYNCSDCFFTNISGKISYDDYEKIFNLQIFNNLKLLYKWDVICTSCNDGYIRKEDSKCYKCSDELNDCEKCFYGNDSWIHCTSCLNSKVIFFEKVNDQYFSRCKTCSDLIPNCNSCKYGLYENETIYYYDNRNISNSFLNNSNFSMRCIECNSEYGITTPDQIDCSACSSNCEYCYKNTTMFCGRCKANFVLNIYMGICVSISSYSNITADYKISCSRIVSQNPWATNFTDYSLFLCQKCTNTLLYPSMNGKCIKCSDLKCQTCQEASGASNNASTIKYSDILYKSPLSLLNLISQGTTVASIQKCLSCANTNNAFESSLESCCSPSTQIQTQNGPKIAIANCQSCGSCSSYGTVIGCKKCSICADVAKTSLNDDNTIKIASYLTAFYGKRIYYQLLKEGSTFGTEPVLSDVETYDNIYNSITSQTQTDFLGNLVFKCLACPVNSLSCSLPASNEFTYDAINFKYKNDDLSDLISYYLHPIKCRDNFVYDGKLKKCKFCPQKWRSCQAYKNITIYFLGASKTISDVYSVQTIRDLTDYLNKLEFSEFPYICNEFSVETVDIQIILDSGEEITWHDAASFNIAFQGTLKSRVPTLKNYNLIFKSKDEYSKLNIGCSIIFSGFDSIKFHNIIFKPFRTAILEKMYAIQGLSEFFPNIQINGVEIKLLKCKLMYEEVNKKILVDKKIIDLDNQNNFTQFLCFYFKADNLLEISEFTMENIKFSSSTIPSKRIFQLFSQFIIETNNLNFSNVNFSSLIINDTYSLITLRGLKSSNIYLENILISDSTISDCFFIENTNGPNFILNGLIIEKTTIVNKPLYSCSVVSSKNIVLKNILIQNSDFKGENSYLYLFKSLFIHLAENFVLTKNNFIAANILYIAPDSNINLVTENGVNTLKMKNISLKDNRAFMMDSQTFFLFIENDSMFQVSLFLENLFFENNSLLNEKRAECYFMQMFSLSNFSGNNINFNNNLNFSGISMFQLKNVWITNFSLTFSEKLRDILQPQSVLYFLSISTKIQLTNVLIDTSYTEVGLIFIENTANSEIPTAVEINNLTINNVLIKSLNIGASLLFKSVQRMQISIINTIFSNITLYDESDYVGSAPGITIESSLSSCVIRNTKFFQMLSTGECNTFRGFLTNLSLENSSFSYANYFSKENLTSFIIMNQGSFANLLLVNLFINSTSFSYGYALNGGGIYCTFLKKATTVEVYNSIFFNLFSLSNGGGLFIIKTNEKKLKVLISDSIFKEIASLKNGGGIFISTLLNSEIYIMNSFFSYINALAGGVIYANNILLSLNEVNITEKLMIFPQLTFLLFRQIDLNFWINFQIGSLIYIASSSVEMKKCKFYDLMSSSDQYEPSIITCLSGKFQDFDSVYNNISFWKYAFLFKSTYVIIKNTNYTNLMSESYAKQTVQNIFIIEKQKYYYPFFYIYNEGQLEFYNCLIENLNCSQCKEEGGFVFADSSILKLESVICINNAIWFALINSVSSDVFVNKSNFTNNLATLEGACIRTDESNLNISFSSFSNNIASNGSGGAINFHSENGEYFIIESSLFENNVALIGGAIFYQTVGIYIDLLTKFINNTGLLYGNNYYSYPFSLCFLNISDGKNISCKEQRELKSNFRSGGYLEDFYLKLLDEEGNPIINNQSTNGPSLSIKVSPVLTANENTIYSINNSKLLTNLILSDTGIFPIKNLLIIGKPDSDLKLEFSSSSIKSNKSVATPKSIRDYSISFIIKVRNCSLGEFYQLLTGSCYLCLPGTYSYNPKKEACVDCPEGLNCFGGANTTVQKTFWRSKLLSEQLFYCSKNPDSCVGGPGYADNICLIGHIGAKCESCDLMGTFWKTSFSRTSDFGCVQCQDIVANYIILAVLSLFNFASMIMSIKGTIDNINTRLKLKVIKVFARYSMLFPRKNESSVYIKIYFSYFQIIQVLTLLNLTYPSTLNSIGVTIGTPTNSVLYSTDCMIANFVSAIPYLHVKLIVALLIPFVYLLIFTVGYILFMGKSKYHHKFSMLYTVCLFTLLYFQPSIVENIISVLSCVDVGDESYVKADVAFKCSGYEYEFYSVVIGIPALFFWAIGTPLLILFQLIKNRKNLQSILNQVRYGYLYDEYDIFYWEFIRMYEKILITVILSFYEAQISMKGLLVILIIAIYQLLLYKKNPYKSKRLNMADKFNSSVCYISIFFGLVAYKNNFDYIITICYVVIVITNIAFNIFMLKHIISSYTYSLNDKVKNILQKIKCFPCSKSFFPNVEKKIKTHLKWIRLRQLVSKYLRERERIRLERRNAYKTDEEKYKLTLCDYDENKVGIRKFKKVILKEEYDESQENASSDRMENSIEPTFNLKNLKEFSSNRNEKKFVLNVTLDHNENKNLTEI